MLTTHGLHLYFFPVFFSFYIFYNIFTTFLHFLTTSCGFCSDIGRDIGRITVIRNYNKVVVSAHHIVGTTMARLSVG